MNELQPFFDKPELPEKWDYQESVNKVKGLISEKIDLIEKVKRKFHIGKNEALKILNEEKQIVYFLQAKNGLIKIGKCYKSQINSRISIHQISSPEKLKLIGSTNKFSEKQVHKIFIKHRSHGEWFYPDEKLINFIKGINNE